jgi:hypothetical protein
MKKLLTKLFRKNLELLFWIAAIIVLFFLPVNKPGSSLCLSVLLGFGHCPGCGIGHAIHYALHLKFALSFQSHPLGIFGVMIIFMRIWQLTKTVNPLYETQPNQHDTRH